MKIEPKEGMRVHVYSPDMKTDLGEGTIETVESLIIESIGLTIPFYPSRIVLDSGEEMEGCNCWWGPTQEKVDEWADPKANPAQDIKDVIAYLTKETKYPVLKKQSYILKKIKSLYAWAKKEK